MRKYWVNNKKGFIFLSTLVALSTMVLIGTSLFSYTNNILYFFGKLKKSTQANYLAQAGMACAMANLASSYTSNATYAPVSLEPGAFQATVSTYNGRTLVSSTGTSQGISRTITAEVTGPTASALDYAMASGDELEFQLVGQSTLTVTGKIYAAEEVELTAQAGSTAISLTATGNIYSAGSISVSGSGSITTGSRNSNGPVVGFPTIDFGYYKNEAQTGGGTYVAGNVTYGTSNPIPSPAGRVIYVNGNLTISGGTQTTNSAIIVTGNVLISKGTLTINQPPNYIALATKTGDITISGTGASNPSSLTANGLVYSGNEFEITGNHHTITINNGALLAKGEIESESPGNAQSTVTVMYQSGGFPLLAGVIGSGTSLVGIKSYNT